VRTLVGQSPATLSRLSTETDLDRSQLRKALDALVAEGMIEPAEDGTYRLPGT
jgi:DNA-binding IclR family transcriptional regulator